MVRPLPMPRCTALLAARPVGAQRWQRVVDEWFVGLGVLQIRYGGVAKLAVVQLVRSWQAYWRGGDGGREPVSDTHT